MSAIPSPEDAFDRGSKTADKDEKGRFVIGHKRSPGRPKGSRVRLTEKFFAALHDDFEENGVEAIARVRFHDPSTYMNIVAKLMPREMKLEITNPTDEMSDAQLRAMIEYFEAIAARGQAIEGEARNVTPALAAPSFDTAPVPDAEQRAEADRQALLDQSEAINAAPYPVHRKPPTQAARAIERANIAKLDDINPEDLF